MWPAGSGVTTCREGAPIHRQLYAYDFAGRLISETVTRNGVTLTVSYGCDANSNRIHVQWLDGYRALYQYDALDRLTAVLSDQDGDRTSSDLLDACAYSWGRLTVTRRRASASGQSGYAGAVAWAYQPDGDLIGGAHVDAAGAEIVTFAHEYDGAGRLANSQASVSGWP